jgi:pyruvate-formate lyase-activating enzyme
VNHAGNAINVDSAGCNIGCNNCLSPTLAELLKCTLALALAAVTVNGNGSHAALF